MGIVSAVASTLLTTVASDILDSSVRRIIKDRDYEFNEDTVHEEPELYLTQRDVNDLDEKESIGALENTIESIEDIREEILRQAKLAYNCALLAVFIGIILIFVGIFFIYLNKVEITIISSAAGILSEFISAVLFNFSNRANDKLEKVQRDLSKFENAKIGLELINNIEDQSTKDAAISKLIDEIVKNLSKAA
ncbi:TRADD-N-associated membrane domain-containing protein [Wukongibacter sp. M2B1]|uniref:TRADD-N-associated membrane domain-containing protein n=1 Tax=Wukongibacter sp. M2B1 TaxID=3088895 RepID=UPI003D7A0301